jgi:hypothetical protein
MLKLFQERGERGKGKQMEWVNSTWIYYKNFWKCHNVLQYSNNMMIKYIKKEKIK